MKRILVAAILAAATVPVFAQDVGVSIRIGDPNFYGRIELGNAPPPRVIYTQPRVVEHVTVVEEPVYLRVPPGHRKHWAKHCREYDACGRPVYFVRDDWYQHDYAPRYRHEHGDHDDDHDEGHGDHDHGHGKGHDKHDHD